MPRRLTRVRSSTHRREQRNYGGRSCPDRHQEGPPQMRISNTHEWQQEPAESQEGLSALWLNGPAQDATLDVGVITFAPGAATPLHVHHVGQAFVILAGSGFVQVGDERTELGVGDIVVSSAGEWHTHGAGPDGPMVHLSVTTGRNEVQSGTY